MFENENVFIIFFIICFSVSQNTQVTEAWNKIAQSFKCMAIEGELNIT